MFKLCLEVSEKPRKLSIQSMFSMLEQYCGKIQNQVTKHGMAGTQTEEALYFEFQHLVTKRIINKMNRLELEKHLEQNQCHKKNMQMMEKLLR